MLKKRPKKFFRISPAGRRALDALIKESPSAARCFIALAGHATRRGLAHCSLKGLASHLDLSLFTISRAVNVLMRMKYVRRAHELGRSSFLINAAVIWMSKPDEIWTAPFHDTSVIPPWRPFLNEAEPDPETPPSET